MQRALENVGERLAGVQVASPAFAVALFSGDPEDLYAANITVGLQSDREKVLQWLDGPGRLAIWNAYEFGAAAPDTPLLGADPGFVEAERAIVEEFYSRDDPDPQRYVLNRVADQFDPTRLPFPVTDDFVAYAYAEDHYELVENLRFSASPASLELLEARGLVFDLPDY